MAGTVAVVVSGDDVELALQLPAVPAVVPAVATAGDLGATGGAGRVGGFSLGGWSGRGATGGGIYSYSTNLSKVNCLLMSTTFNRKVNSVGMTLTFDRDN